MTGGNPSVTCVTDNIPRTQGKAILCGLLFPAETAVNLQFHFLMQKTRPEKSRSGPNLCQASTVTQKPWTAPGFSAITAALLTIGTGIRQKGYRGTLPASLDHSEKP